MSAAVHPDVLDLLLARRSAHRLVHPPPTREQLDTIVSCAQAAPDHGLLQPWRLIIIRDRALDRLSSAFAAATLAAEPDASADALARVRRKARRAPMIITVVFSPSESDTRIPRWEQQAAAVCAAHSILIAAHCVGLGAIWRTGRWTNHSLIRRELGLGDSEEIIGWIYIGTRADHMTDTKKPKRRPPKVTELVPQNPGTAVPAAPNSQGRHRMTMTVEEIAAHVKNHRCHNHPIFEHWARKNPAPEVVGGLFHQIQLFCASTRPGRNFPTALQQLDFSGESRLLQEIVESEEDHGAELATMAGYILNARAGQDVCPDLSDQTGVEKILRDLSDRLLGTLPGYDPETGLTVQARQAIRVFERRDLTDRETTLKNLGTAIALEMISNRMIIPGEKHALVDSGLYDADLEVPELHYLLEHWGEAGAEAMHEKNAMTAVASVLNEETEPLIMAGVNDFLDSLTALWDLLDSALLNSGMPEPVPAG